MMVKVSTVLFENTDPLNTSGNLFALTVKNISSEPRLEGLQQWGIYDLGRWHVPSPYGPAQGIRQVISIWDAPGPGKLLRRFVCW